jgi:SpoVK/Ycf46/Vps4 family AAA+-type ATPase
MGMPVLQKRASDIFGKFVGETEHDTSLAFSEAVNSGAFLIFDECDSLLATRESAHRNFEISFVNEMLSQMERHPLPFAATTNLLSRIDSASLRRFLFKSSFSYLAAAQVSKAFTRFFGTGLAGWHSRARPPHPRRLRPRQPWRRPAR